LLRPQRWEQSLSDIQHPLQEDSLIPMFEGMVDRALSRTHSAPVTASDNKDAVIPRPTAIPNDAVAARAAAIR
jgi:hypothetical protein